MFRHLLFLLTSGLFTMSCTEVQKTPDVTAIHDQIMDKGQDVIWALNEANIDTLVRDFWQSDSAYLIIDGIRIQGYDNIEKALRGIPDRRKSIRLTEDKVDVYVRTPDVAVHVLEFHEEVTHLNDSISSGQGIWTATYQRMADDWKVVAVHESHLSH